MVLKTHFRSPGAPEIRRKLPKWAIGPDTDSARLAEAALGVSGREGMGRGGGGGVARREVEKAER